MKFKRIYIEITNICNLNCSFCQKNTRTPQFMSIENFKHIIQQIKPYSSYIYLHVQGEPLLHPDLNELLNICDNENIQVQLVTNGTLIKNHMDIYKHPSLRKISFSLHSIDQQSIDALEYYLPIDTFINNAANKFIELRFWNRNDMQEKSKKIYEYISNNYNLQATNKIDSYKLTSNIYLYFQDEFEWPTVAKNDNPNGYCYAAKNMLAILVDGQVSICCLDAQGEINLGNIFNQDLSSILNSDKYQSILNEFAKNKCHEELCQRCTYRKRFNS